MFGVKYSENTLSLGATTIFFEKYFSKILFSKIFFEVFFFFIISKNLPLKGKFFEMVSRALPPGGVWGASPPRNLR